MPIKITIKEIRIKNNLNLFLKKKLYSLDKNGSNTKQIARKNINFSVVMMEYINNGINEIKIYPEKILMEK
jgi:hypothetical protein